jgi:hypothetical protein
MSKVLGCLGKVCPRSASGEVGAYAQISNDFDPQCAHATIRLRMRGLDLYSEIRGAREVKGPQGAAMSKVYQREAGTCLRTVPTSPSADRGVPTG